MISLCSDAEINGLANDIQNDDEGDLQRVDLLLTRYPEDPRLHFMRGSVLAGRQRSIEAHTAFSKAVELAPDFTLARYQLGFFELTSGEVDRALSTWGPLMKLPAENYLRNFVEGMTHLIRDEFDEAIAKMHAGIKLNQENIPMNRDIELLIAECEKARTNNNQSGDDEDVQSATSLILGQLSSNSTKH